MTTTKKFLKKNVFEEKEKRMFAVPKKKTVKAVTNKI